MEEATMGDRNPQFTTHDAPFGYQIFHRSSSSNSDLPFDPQGHLRRVAQPQSSRIKEVPSLENVEAFCSDPVVPDDDPFSSSKTRERVHSAGSDEARSDKSDLIKQLDPSKVIEQVDRVLSSSWKFNSFAKAVPGCMDPPPRDTELTDDELKWVNSNKEEREKAKATELQLMYARGLVELRKIKKRNEKHLTISVWPEDTPELNDKAFVEEVNTHTFYSRGPNSVRVDDRIHEVGVGDGRGNNQGIFKDSAVYMEDEFEKEALKGSPTTTTQPRNGFNEEAVTESFIEDPADEVTYDSYVSGELHQKLGHDVLDAGVFGTTSATDMDLHMLHPEVQEESIQTSLALFDDANAPFDEPRDDQPYGLREIAKGSVEDRAMEDTLFLDNFSWSILHNHNNQQEIVEDSPSPQDWNFTGTPSEASSEDDANVIPAAEATQAPILDTDIVSSVVGSVGDGRASAMVLEPIDQAVIGYGTNTYTAETPRAPPSPPFGSISLPTHRELTPPNALPDAHDWSTLSADSNVNYHAPTPMLVSSSPPAILEASNVADTNRPEDGINVFNAPTPTYSMPFRPNAIKEASSAAEPYFHDNGPFSAPTPMYPISSSPRDATGVSYAVEIPVPEDNSAAFYAPTSMVPMSSSPHAIAEASNAAETYSHSNGLLHAPTPMYRTSSSLDVTAAMEASIATEAEGYFVDLFPDANPEPLSSASQQLFQDLYAAANNSTTAERGHGQSPTAPAYAPTPMVLDDSDHEGYDLQQGFLPAANRSISPYRSPYPSVSSDDRSHPQKNGQASSPVVGPPERPRFGALRLPGHPAMVREDTNSSMEDHPPSSPRDDAQQPNTALSAYIQANSAPSLLTHEDSNMSLEVYADSSSTGMAPESPTPNRGPNPNFAAGARELASSFTRPSTPTTPTATPYSLSPAGAALRLTLPKERQTPERTWTRGNASTPTPTPAPRTGDKATPSPASDGPAFGTRKRARAATAVASSRGQAKGPRRTGTSTSKTESQGAAQATGIADNSGVEVRVASAGGSQQGQPPKKKGRPSKKTGGGAAGSA